jgi:hypothetical protein
MEKDNLVKSFHEMWDAFPGMARLISSNHEILAANDIAVKVDIFRQQLIHGLAAVCFRMRFDL